MPNITVYLDNQTHSEFVNLENEQQKQLKTKFVKDIKKEINKR